MKIQNVSSHSIVRSVSGKVYCVRGKVLGSNDVSAWEIRDMEIPVSGFHKVLPADTEVQQIATFLYKEPKAVSSPIDWNGPRRQNGFWSKDRA